MKEKTQEYPNLFFILTAIFILMPFLSESVENNFFSLVLLNFLCVIECVIINSIMTLTNSLIDSG